MKTEKKVENSGRRSERGPPTGGPLQVLGSVAELLRGKFCTARALLGDSECN